MFNKRKLAEIQESIKQGDSLRENLKTRLLSLENTVELLLDELGLVKALELGTPSRNVLTSKDNIEPQEYYGLPVVKQKQKTVKSK